MANNAKGHAAQSHDASLKSRSKRLPTFESEDIRRPVVAGLDDDDAVVMAVIQLVLHEA